MIFTKNFQHSLALRQGFQPFQLLCFYRTENFSPLSKGKCKENFQFSQVEETLQTDFSEFRKALLADFKI